MAERLHFGDVSSRYDAMVAAEHVVRYHCVRELCRGKRVLDVACGEGYGSGLLAKWGAAEVVGVDVSDEAIAAARKTFAHGNITFIQGDACRLDGVLGDVPGFDLIVSFETIEHVPDVPGLLSGIKQYRAPQGTVVISCPNDHVEEEDNPYHMRRYTFDEFRAVAAAGLGPACGWLLGTPAQGQILYPLGEPRMENKTDSRMCLITQCQDLAHATAIPAQPNVAPDAGTCKFYVGYWGEPVDMCTAVSPQSHPSFLEPWRALAWFKQQREEGNIRYEDLRIAKIQTERQLADLRRRALVQTRAVQQELQRADAELAQLRSETVLAKAENVQAKAETLQVRAELEEWRQFKQSRTYRLMQAYVHSYELPVAGPVLRRLRRVAGRTLRSVRPR